MFKWIGLVSAGIGLFLSIFGIYFLVDAYSTVSWPTVEGKIVSTQVKTNVGNVSEARHRIYTYYPSVEYTYEVNGIQYTSSRYQLGQNHPDYSEKAEAIHAAKAFQKDQPIAIFYDPRDPSQSVLNTSISVGAYVPLPFGLLLLFTGLALYRWAPLLEAAANNEPNELTSGEPANG